MSSNLTQLEANALIHLSKHYNGEELFTFPSIGGSLRVDLYSDDQREEFSLDITRGRINLSKNTFQNRARKSIILVRLDIDGPPHRNPDGEEISCPHIHLFREGFGDKWAYPVPDVFTDCQQKEQTLDAFMEYCNIHTCPLFVKELFIG